MSALNGIVSPSGGGAGGSGDVVGPASSTDNAIVRYDGTTGKLLQNSSVTIDDSNVMSGATQLNVDNLRLDGNTLSSTNTNGNVVAQANGTSGKVVAKSDAGLLLENQNGTLTAILQAAFSSTRVLNSAANAWTALSASSVLLTSAGMVGFSSSSIPESSDTGLARSAAGVVKVTDGSTGIRGLLGGGTAVASAAAMPLPTGRVFHVTGTTNITSITSTNFQSGAVITLIFDDVLTFTDGNNLKLAGDFVTTADDTITLVYDGTNWYEISRSIN